MKQNEITINEALRCIETHNRNEMLWRSKAINLLQLVGSDGIGIDQKKLIEMCKAHAEDGLAL